MKLAFWHRKHKHEIDWVEKPPDGYRVSQGGAFKIKCIGCGKTGEYCPLPGVVRWDDNEYSYGV